MSLALLFDILADHGLIGMAANSAGKIAIRIEYAASGGEFNPKRLKLYDHLLLCASSRSWQFL